MTKKPVVQVTKPASSLCNGEVNRAARAAMEANMERIRQAAAAALEKQRREGK